MSTYSIRVKSKSESKQIETRNQQSKTILATFKKASTKHRTKRGMTLNCLAPLTHFGISALMDLWFETFGAELYDSLAPFAVLQVGQVGQAGQEGKRGKLDKGGKCGKSSKWAR